MAELLLVGGIVNEAVPTGAGAQLWVQAEGFGQSAGVDNAGVVQTPHQSPAGSAGVVVGRGVTVLIGYDAACTVRITPIIDVNTVLTTRAKVQTFAAPASYTRSPLTVRFARQLTYIAVLIEIISRSGPVDIGTPTLVGRVKAVGSALADRAELP